jgi:hypothetical protein
VLCKLSECFGPDQGNVSDKYQDIVSGFEFTQALGNRMPGTELLQLLNKVQLLPLHYLPNLFCLMANDYHHLFRRE